MTPKEKAKELFNKIRYMDNESGKNCSTCDCVVIPIAKFICDEILNQYESGKFDYKILDEEESNYWVSVKAEIEKL